jgi:stage V sporulation protein B
MSRLPGLWQSLRHRASVRAVGTMVSSSALGQLAVFSTLPLVTRLYDPAAFGRHALFMSFVGIATVGVCLCLDHRIVSTVDDSEADNVFAAALMTVPLAALASTLALSALVGCSLFGYGALPWWSVPLMAAMITLNGVFSACRSRVLRQQDFLLIARTGLMQNIGRALAPLALYPLVPFWLGLTAGELTGRSVGVWSLTRRAWQRRLGSAVWRDGSAWRAVVRREYRFTGVLFGTVLVDALASQMISPLFAAIYGAQAAGEYFLVSMLLVAPSVLIGAGASDVIHAKGAEIYNRAPAELPAFARQAALALSAVGLAIFVPVYFAAPHVLPLVFGQKWPHVDECVRALVPFAIVGFVASPCSRLLLAINSMNVKVVSDAVRLIGVPVTLYMSHEHGADYVQAMHNLGTFLAAAYFIYFALTYATVVRSARKARS